MIIRTRIRFRLNAQAWIGLDRQKRHYVYTKRIKKGCKYVDAHGVSAWGLDLYVTVQSGLDLWTYQGGKHRIYSGFSTSPFGHCHWKQCPKVTYPIELLILLARVGSKHTLKWPMGFPMAHGFPWPMVNPSTMPNMTRFPLAMPRRRLTGTQKRSRS